MPFDRETLLNIKFDTGYASEWDLKLDASSRHAALGGLTVMPEVTAELTGIPAPDPATAFRDAVAYLHEHYGRIDPEWGEVNVLIRGDKKLPLDGGPDTLRAIYPEEIGEDGILKANGGDTWIALVEWDAEGNQTADIIHQFGTATLDESSPHYSDQAELFAKKQWRKAALDRDSILRLASRTYSPHDTAKDE